MRNLLPFAVALLVLVLAGFAFGVPEKPAAPAPATSSAVVGPETCAECHPDLHAAWRESTHARTLLDATRETLPRVMWEGGEILHPPARSRFEREGDRVFVRTIGPEGTEESYPVDGILGARRVRMFLTTMPDGRRQVLPFMLDEPYERYFDYTDLIFGAGGPDPNVSPEIRPGEPSFWTGYTRTFDARCGRCHTTGFEFRGFDAKPGEPHSTWDRAGVTCESCHGAAKAHVDYWNDRAPPETTEDPIASMGGLDPARVNDMCLSCHTEAEQVKPFALGDPFLPAFDPTLLDDVERFDPSGRPIELAYDGVPFSASRCAREGGLTCMTCHDPHGTPYRAQLVAPPGSDALCAKCHQDVIDAGPAHSHHSPKSVGGQCTSCHMPFLSVERGHGVVTDHTIGVPDPSTTGPRVAADACTWCHTGARGAPGGVPRLARETVRKAWSEWWPDATGTPDWAKTLLAARNDDPAVVPDLAALAADASRPSVVRASAAALLGWFPETAAKHLYRLARDDDALVRSRVASALAGVSTPEADSVLLGLVLDDEPIVRRHAARAALAGWRRVRNDRSLLEPVLVALEERTEAFPTDDQAWFLLGAARQLAGDPAGAVKAYERKLALDPYAKLVRREVERLRGGR